MVLLAFFAHIFEQTKKRAKKRANPTYLNGFCSLWFAHTTILLEMLILPKMHDQSVALMKQRICRRCSMMILISSI
jgi:hypothetical protein